MLTFKTIDFESMTILTLLVDSINASNSNVIKSEILEFLSSNQIKGLIFNLSNVREITSVGVGALISINSKSKRFDHYALSGISPEVEATLKASRLDILFQIITPESDCIICEKSECSHLEDLNEKLQLFTSWEDLVSEFPQKKNQEKKESLAKKIVRRLTGQLDPNIAQRAAEQRVYEIKEKERLQKERKKKMVNYVLIFALSSLFVGGGGSLLFFAIKSGFVDGSSNRWRRNSQIKVKEKISEIEILERFDRNGDGVFNKADWLLLQGSEKLFLINQGISYRKEMKRKAKDEW